MIGFYLGLAAVNLVCFLPLYLLNFHEQPNPIAFLTEERFFNRNKWKLLYTKLSFTDPFHVNFDFSVALLVAVCVGFDGPVATALLSFVLAFSFVEIVYTSVMRSIFKRAPTLISDISFAKVGLTIAHRWRAAILAGFLVLLVAVAALSFVATSALLDVAPRGHWSLLLVAALIVPPGVYHWRSYAYSEYIQRTVYSATMHFWLNLQVSRRFSSVLHLDASYFEQYNAFGGVELRQRPNVVTVCIESYGSVVYRNPEVYREVAPLLERFSSVLNDRGLAVASNFSAAPLFAGGSWMSYASFAYGVKIHDIWSYDLLFSQSEAFRSYESLFHVLRRNGYRSELLCPLGGVDAKHVNWNSINRCFQSDRNIEFGTLGFEGPRLSYFVQKETYCPPDEYALNWAYENCKETIEGPFSLFFCTLNSHYPYHSPLRTAGDWRLLNDPAHRIAMTQDVCNSALERYAAAIRYQLEFVLQFVERHAGDDLIVTLFGDHQPPMVAPESLGTHTPVHVIARNETLIESLSGAGFCRVLDPSTDPPEPINHEGFLSLMMRGMNAAYGAQPDLDIRYRPDGVELFEVDRT